MARFSLRVLGRDTAATAGAEMAMVAPMLIVLMFGSAELGNYFLNQHAVTEQVRDGARFASRMTLATAYDCKDGRVSASGVYQDANAETNIVNVTKTGSVDGSATGRFAANFWTACAGNTEAVTATMRCVDKAGYSGLYSGLPGSKIPVVKVSANVKYPSLFGAVGFNAVNLCLGASSEAAVAGL